METWRLERFMQSFRDARIEVWRDLTEDSQLEVVLYAFNNATEIDLQRFVKIARWRGDGNIPMNLPEWAMLIWERR